MRAMTSVVSITIHAALGAAVFFGTARTNRSTATPAAPVVVVFPQAPRTEGASVVGLPSFGNPAIPDMARIPLPATVLQTGAPSPSVFPTSVLATVTTGSGQPSGGWAGVLDEERPEVLTGPLPAYPELLRRAGIEGQVVVEALVDTTGRVRPTSISVVSATNPAFIAPARQALLATLFRPARVGARPVPMLVRIPFAFSIRGNGGTP